MGSTAATYSRIDAKRREQTPQALARLAIVGLFIGLWLLLWLAQTPMPFPFLLVLVAEVVFFLAYWRGVALLRSVRAIELAQYGMLGAEIIFHTTMVYFLGGISWLGAFAYVFGLIFTNTFLDLRRGFVYTSGASLAFVALIVLEATGTIPHQVYMEQGALRYADARVVATTAVGGFGVFFSVYLWVNWVGHQLRRERDTAVRAQDNLLEARVALLRANDELEVRVRTRTDELEVANAALSNSEERLRTVVTNVAVVLFALDRDGIFTLSEGRGLEALGVEPGQVVGLSVFEVYRDVPEIGQNIRRALAGEGFTATVEVGELSFETHYTPIRDEGGQVAGVIGVATDVTERRETIEALQRLKRQNELILRSAGEGIYGLDIEGRTTFVNPAAARMLQWKVEELIGEPAHKIMHHTRADGSPYAREECPIYAAFKDGAVHHVTEEVFWKQDGTSFPVEYFSTPIRDELDELAGAVVTFRDVTERRQAEEALRESEAKYRQMFENVQDLFYQTTVTGTITEISPSVERYGYTREELIGTPVLDVYDDPEERAAFIEAMMADGEVTDYEIHLKAGDGTVIHASVSARLFHDAGGEPAGFEGTIRDVSERKRTEEALRESEGKFRAMAETVAAAAFIFQGTKMKYVNSAAEAMTGYTREELLTMNFWDVIHPDFRDLVQERGIARQRGEDIPVGYEVKIITKRGDERWVDFTAGLIEFEGAPAVLGTAFDITERKRAEEALKAAASHDPLTGLLNRGAGLAAIEERLEHAKNTGGRFAALVLDVDRFKVVNDTYGHEAGDDALVRLASVMLAAVGDLGVVCRLGGDEFQVGLDDAGLEQALIVGEELQASLRRTLEHPDRDGGPVFTVSTGIACYPADGVSIDELGRRADQAMYAGKAAGGNTTRAWRRLDADRAA